MGKILSLSELQDIRVRVYFEGDVNTCEEISYDDARLLCDLQENFGKRIQAENAKQLDQYEKLRKIRLLNRFENACGEYELSGFAVRAKYLIE